MQASLRAGVRSTLAALLEAPESLMQVAVQPRNFSSTSLITSTGGSSGSGLGLVASHSMSIIVSPPVRLPGRCFCQLSACSPVTSTCLLRHMEIGLGRALSAPATEGEGQGARMTHGAAMMGLEGERCAAWYCCLLAKTQMISMRALRREEVNVLQAAAQARMDSFSAASARRALGSLQAVRWTGDAPGFSNVRVRFAGRTGVCGNGLCEVRLPKASATWTVPHPRTATVLQYTYHQLAPLPHMCFARIACHEHGIAILPVVGEYEGCHACRWEKGRPGV